MSNNISCEYCGIAVERTFSYYDEDIEEDVDICQDCIEMEHGN